MRLFASWACGQLLFWCSLSAMAPSALGRDHFLVIGGGDSPTNNQISLEKNVLFFQRLIEDAYGPAALCDVLFSDGSANFRDVRFTPDADPPRVNVLLARLFDDDADLYDEYRPHNIPHVVGPSTRQGLDAWFNSVGKTLGADDRLIIYFTGHGGPGNPARNTTISMWCERPMHVTEFTGLLDRLSPRTRVVLFMVQCHAGGFADAIFQNARTGGALSPARRCGFFATVFDRSAAGCTPDAAEEDYKDYSTDFFAALDGKTRAGKPLTGCDLNGDGQISFAEAHTHVLLSSDTIDIPNTTSDTLLRQFSKTIGPDLLKPDSPFDEVLAAAPAVYKPVLTGLSEQLKLKGVNRWDDARRLADSLDGKRKDAERDQSRKNDEVKKLAVRIRKRVLQHWPELASPWHPRTPELIKSDGPAIQQAIEQDSDYPRWDLLQRDADAAYDKALDFERQWAKCQRLIRTLETAALAANLEKSAPPAIVARYKQLIEDEAGALGK